MSGQAEMRKSLARIVGLADVGACFFIHRGGRVVLREVDHSFAEQELAEATIAVVAASKRVAGWLALGYLKQLIFSGCWGRVVLLEVPGGVVAVVVTGDRKPFAELLMEIGSHTKRLQGS